MNRIAVHLFGFEVIAIEWGQVELEDEGKPFDGARTTDANIERRFGLEYDQHNEIEGDPFPDDKKIGFMVDKSATEAVD